MSQYILRAVNNFGQVSYYNGKAGPAWTSPEPFEAFTYQNIDRARTLATNFNRMSSVHGLRFVAVTAPLLGD